MRRQEGETDGGGVVYQGWGATWYQVVLEGFSEEVVLDVRSEMRGESRRRVFQAEGTARAKRDQHFQRPGVESEEEGDGVHCGQQGNCGVGRGWGVKGTVWIGQSLVAAGGMGAGGESREAEGD